MFEIDKKTLKEIDAMKKTMQTLEKMGSAVKAAVLKSRQHQNQYPEVKKDPGLSNRQVLEYMADQGRDFIGPTSNEVTSIAQAYVDEAGKRLAAQNAGKSKIKNPKAAASNISGHGFKAAGFRWMEIATDRIEDEGWEGDGEHSLNPEYERKKIEDIGRAHPIGIRSGQVADNLKPAKKNIKLER
ncbi:MAG: hypothetical protein GY854_19815 [Deltaproteobacteria bacterium]|nr:hypothetical protein [Deltaproteobacteria bacterium]